MKKRWIYIVLSIATFAFGIALLLVFKDNSLLRGFFGDIAIILFMFFVAKSFYNIPTLALGFSIFGFACLIELLQLFNLAEILGQRSNPVFQVLLGSTFDPFDFLAYFIGTAAVIGIDLLVQRKPITDRST